MCIFGASITTPTTHVGGLTNAAFARGDNKQTLGKLHISKLVIFQHACFKLCYINLLICLHRLENATLGTSPYEPRAGRSLAHQMD